VAKDKLLRSPNLSRAILGIGAALYFLACIPLYGQRGYPAKNPFWEAMLWLAIPSVVISAISDSFNARRMLDLGPYVLVCAFIFSYSDLLARKDPAPVLR